MLSTAAFIMMLLAVIFGVTGGKMAEVASAALDGAQAAVEVSILLCGMMCLWGGVCRVLEKAGVIRRIAPLFVPLLRFLFPDVEPGSEAGQAIIANISANMLGIGNAATPLGIRAVKALRDGRIKENRQASGRIGIGKGATSGVESERRADTSARTTGEAAEDDILALAVLNTAPVSLLPSTILALRRGAGSASPFRVVVPIWICSLCGAVFLAVLLRLFRAKSKKSAKSEKTEKLSAREGVREHAGAMCDGASGDAGRFHGKCRILDASKHPFLKQK